MYKILAIGIVTFLTSCSANNENKIPEKEIELNTFKDVSEIEQQKRDEEIALLKDFTFCECMVKATQKFNAFDSTELYGLGTSLKLEMHQIDPFWISDTLDSAIYKEVVHDQIIKKTDLSRQVAEGTLGKTTYLEACLEFSRSKKLDSLLRKIPRSKYYRPLE